MTLYFIILIVSTVATAIVFNTNISKKKLIKYISGGLYFIIAEIFLFKLTGDFVVPLISFAVILIVGFVIAVIWGSFKLSAKNKILKNLMFIIFSIMFLYLSIYIYKSITKPISFEEDKQKRYIEAVNELIKIRKAQTYYKKEYGKYTDNFSELVRFITFDSITVVKKQGEIPDSIYLKSGNDLLKAEKTALKLKIITRDTSRISVKDSLFKNIDIKKLGTLPSNENIKFEMDTATLVNGGVKVHVFEARIPNMILLNGLDADLILNLDDNAVNAKKYPGLKVGSITENNFNEGNWDKEIEAKYLKN